MPHIDRRIISFDLETPRGKKHYDGLNVEYSLVKTGGTSMNEAQIRVANLDRDERNFLVTTTSPLARPRRRSAITIYAGYESRGVTRRFVGDIFSVTPSQPPDIWLTMKARTGHFDQCATVACTAPARCNLSTLAGLVADDLGLVLEFQAEDKTIGSHSFSGPALRQVDKLAEAGLVDAFIDDDRLVVKDRGAPLRGKRRKLSKESGMIGMPSVTEKGVNVTMLLDAHTVIGTQLEIESEFNPAANGLFTVCSLRENCSLRNRPFYIEAETIRTGLGGMAT